MPLFVRDPGVEDVGFATPNRTAFLHDALADLRASLRDLGGDLVIRHGDPAHEAVALAHRSGADRIYVAADVTAFARRREERLHRTAGAHAIEVTATPGVTVVPPGRLTASGGGPYRVFTPFWRAWAAVRWRAVAASPTRLSLPADVDPGELPPADRTDCSPRLPAGGETTGRQMLAPGRATASPTTRRTTTTSRPTAPRGSAPTSTSAACLRSRLPTRLAHRPGGEAFVRQLAWRDFHHETIAHFPALPHGDLRPAAAIGSTPPTSSKRGRRAGPASRWSTLACTNSSRRAGCTTGPGSSPPSYLTKTLGINWRNGARHFQRWLVDGDIANNFANWQWVAGTGTDTRPYASSTPPGRPPATTPRATTWPATCGSARRRHEARGHARAARCSVARSAGAGDGAAAEHRVGLAAPAVVRGG